MGGLPKGSLPSSKSPVIYTLSGREPPFGETQPSSLVTAIHNSPKLPLFLNNEHHFGSFTYGVILPHKRHSALKFQIQTHYLDEYFLL